MNFSQIKDFLFRNQTVRQTVAKNTFWLTVSNFGGRLIRAVIILYAARILGTEGYGLFSYAITLTGFLSMFMDLGINGILIRDTAKASEEERRIIFDTTFAIKIILLILGIGVVIFVAPHFTTLPGAVILLPIVAIILAFDTLRDFFASFLRAMERMEWEAAAFLITNLGIVIFGFIFLYYSPTAQSFGWGYVAGDVIGVFFTIAILRRYFKRIFSHFSRARVIPILRAAWPLALSGAIGLLFTNTDILIISWMRSASEVGIYSAAIRIIQIIYSIVAIIELSTLPLFSRLAKQDNVKFRLVLEKTLSILLMIAIPLSWGGIILGTPIMEFLFGTDYRPGGLSLQILMATLMFDFTATVIINALFVYDRQKTLVVSSLMAGSLNVALDFILIPKYGIASSAVTTLIAQALNNWYLWRAMKKVNYFQVLPYLKNITIAGIGMAAGTLALVILGVNVIVNIVLSALVYFFILRARREQLFIEIKQLLFPSTGAAATQ